MSIICRPAEPQDIPKAIAIRTVASSNFKEKYGFVGKKKEEAFTPDSFYAFTMAHEPEGFWVAEEGGRMVGMMIVWVRDTFWFLSYLFVTPEYQDRKVGTHLLDTALQNIAPSTISNRALITYAYNTASIGIYMKYGIFSREAVYKMAGGGSFIRSQVRKKIPAEIVRFESSPGALHDLASIDEKVFGFSRGRHHAFFLQRRDAQGYLFRSGKDILGYSYIWDDGQVGPLAASSEGSFGDILNASLSLAAAKGVEQVSILVPGSNTLAITTALQHRLSVREPYILMATKPFGRWSQCLLHSPALL